MLSAQILCGRRVSESRYQYTTGTRVVTDDLHQAQAEDTAKQNLLLPVQLQVP
jgi:hypothetical protein